ncbi:MAG: hypothetical protein FWD24_01230 [Treponema sp.]|nr:hypothetical protein [Treponema sp.]
MKNVFLIIFIISLLLTGCIDPIDPFLNDTLPEGYGYFSMSLNNSGARNIIAPQQTYLNGLINEIAVLELNFGSVFIYIYDPGTSIFIAVPVGTYTLTVTAYKDDDLQVPFLHYVSAPNSVTISAGTNSPFDVTLLPLVMNGTDDGFFSWLITRPAGSLTEATMEIQNANTGAVVQSYNFITSPGDLNKTAEADWLPLPSGYYRVIIKFKRDNNHQEYVDRRALHIYPEIQTHFAGDFSSVVFNPISSGNNNSAGLTLTPGDIEDIDFNPPPITWNRDNSINPSIDLNLTALTNAGFDTTTIVWVIAGVGLDPDIVEDDEVEFIFDSTRYPGLLFLPVGGGRSVQLSIEKDGVEFRINIPFTITE